VAQRPEPGFGGLAWGDPPTAEMVLVDGRTDGEATYSKGPEPARFAGVHADAIRWVFWKNRLMMVGVHGTSGFSTLLASLAETWGPGFQADAHQQRYTWMSRGPAGRTIAGLDVENATGFYLAVFSEDLTDALELEQTLSRR